MPHHMPSAPRGCRSSETSAAAAQKPFEHDGLESMIRLCLVRNSILCLVRNTMLYLVRNTMLHLARYHAIFSAKYHDIFSAKYHAIFSAKYHAIFSAKYHAQSRHAAFPPRPRASPSYRRQHRRHRASTERRRWLGEVAQKSLGLRGC